MPQTMLALLALALATLLGFSQQRATVQSYEVRLRDEYTVAASGMMMQVMELIASRSYDEASTPRRIRHRRGLPDIADFTAPDAFGIIQSPPGGGLGLGSGVALPNQEGETVRCDLMEAWQTPACNDIDDLSGLERVPVEIPLSNGHALRFEVSVLVEYVDDDDLTQAVDYRTYNKRVTLTARAADLQRLGDLVRLERVIAYDPIKASADHEAMFGPLVN